MLTAVLLHDGGIISSTPRGPLLLQMTAPVRTKISAAAGPFCKVRGVR